MAVETSFVVVKWVEVVRGCEQVGMLDVDADVEKELEVIE